MESANRAADLLRSHGYVVDILPTTVPMGYLADAFIALHMDGDGTGENSGFKLAHGSRRGPYEQQLLDDVSQEFGPATRLPLDYRITAGSRCCSPFYSPPTSSPPPRTTPPLL